VYELFINFKKAYDSVRMEILYNIIIEFGILMKLVRLNKIYLNETYRRVRVVKDLPDMFLISNGLEQGNTLSSFLFNFALEYAISRVQVNQDALKLIGTHQLFFLLMMLIILSCLEIRIQYEVTADNFCFEVVEELRYLGTTVTNQISIQEEIKSRLNKGMLAIIRCRIFCLPVCYREISRLRCAEL